MRKYFALILFTAACTNVPVNGPQYDSVRERLTTEPTSLYVVDDSSTGTITVRRRVADGWDVGTTKLTIERGYIRTMIDDSGNLAIQRLELDLAPITLGVFEKPAELQEVHVRMTTPVQGAVTWASEDDASARIAMPLEFDWAIKFPGEGPYPLATQQLGATHVEVSLGGTPDHVSAQIDIGASGELWNWADIVEMTDIAVSLDAQTY